MFLVFGLGAAACKTVSSSTYPSATTKKWTVVKDGTEKSSPGYDSACGCWREGYRPEQFTLYGLGASPADYYEAGKAWTVCVPPPAPAASTCPKCPAPKPCPPCASGAANDNGFAKYGPTLGFLLAAGVIGGAGYFMYKKGAFGGKKRR